MTAAPLGAGLMAAVLAWVSLPLALALLVGAAVYLGALVGLERVIDPVDLKLVFRLLRRLPLAHRLG